MLSRPASSTPSLAVLGHASSVLAGLGSVAGKSNTSGFRWIDNHVLWSGLKLQPLFGAKDKHGLEAQALSSRVRFLRLARTMNREQRWSVQLVLEGTPHQKEKHVTSEGTCGLDLGPSTIAAVGEKDALLAVSSATK